jgi:RHS repeat-associated protein
MTQYLYGNLSQPFQVTASRAPDNVLTVYYYDPFGALYAFERGGSRYYVGSDHLGTPKVITDNTGNIIRQMEYDSWGVKISDTNPSFDLPVGFSGGIPDDATGIVRFGYRDYEPGTGRWMAKDPIFFRGRQPNLYAYSLNDPVNWKDSNGLKRDPAQFLWGLYQVGEGFGLFITPVWVSAGVLGATGSPLAAGATGAALSPLFPIGINEMKEGVENMREGLTDTQPGGGAGDSGGKPGRFCTFTQ